MIFLKRSFFLLPLFITILACSKKDVLSDAKELTEFKIEAQYNPDFIKKDIPGEIQNNKITITVPKGLNINNLKATLSFKGKQLLIGENEQISTVTANDFTKPITYRVKAEDGSQQSYNLTVNYVDDLGLLFTSFSLPKAKNPDLKEDLNLTIGTTAISGKLRHSKRQFIASFSSQAVDVSVNNVKQQSGITVNDFSSPVIYTLTSDYGIKKQFTVTITWESDIPHIYINTTGNSPIVSKDDYLNASIRIEGNDVFDDYEGTTKIKGRGNSTWGYPKKPYRLKLDQKASLLGLAEDKDWVLLANYLDPTLMLNAVAMKTGQLLNMPYTNHIIPVNLTINGVEVGCYNFTEQVAVATNRINIANGGTLLELDSYYDEPWKFRSDSYDLPVMVKYPDIKVQSELDAIHADFKIMEDAVSAASFPNNNYANYLDIDALVNFLIVCNLTDNEELNHPKSTYVYKPKDGKYSMGPLWDFDWAYGYEGNQNHFNSYNRPLFWSNSSRGTAFFSRFLSDPKIKTLYKQKWTAFKANKLPELLTYIRNTSALIESSQQKDYTIWHRGSGNFKGDTAKLLEWMQNRANYIDNYVSGF